VPTYPGIDFLSGPGKFVVGPGSVHPETGNTYEVVSGRIDAVPDVPPSLLAVIQACPDRPQATSSATDEYLDDEATISRYSEWVRRRAPLAVQGERGDETTYKVACRGRDLGLSPTVVLAILETEGGWNSRCSPPWNEEDLRSKVAHAYKYARGAIGNAHPAADFDPIASALVGAPIENHNLTGSNRRDAVIFEPVDLSIFPEPSQVPMLFGDRIAVGYPNILYGDGGQGKSLLALALATCIAAGKPFCGMTMPVGPVVYIDWELSRDGQLGRAYKIARGLGLGAPPKGLLYLSPESNLPRLIDAAKAWVTTNKPALVVVDSMGPAAGGRPEDSEEAIQLFNAVRSLGVTSLILDHQAKMQAGHEYRNKTVFGSVYKFNLSRSVLHLERVSSAPGELRLLIRHTKSNFGPYAREFGLVVKFTADSTTFLQTDPATDPEYAKALPARAKITAFLTEHGPATASALASGTGEQESTVKNECTRLRKEGLIREAGKDGRKTLWGPCSGPVTASADQSSGTSGRPACNYADILGGGS